MSALVTLTTATASINSLQIAELVESRHDKVKQSITRLIDRAVIAQPPMGNVQEDGGNSRTYTTQVYVFSGEQGKRDSIVVVAQLSPEFTARLVDRWSELEAHAEQPVAFPATHVGNGCALIESISRGLRLSQAGTLGMYHKLAAKSGHAYLLPAYAVDTPANDGTSHPTKSLRDLLKDFGVGFSAQHMNQVLEGAGILEHRTRPGRGSTKKFWSLTDAGLAYGKNMANPVNERETQPHFYESEFGKLLSRVGVQAQGAAA